MGVDAFPTLFLSHGSPMHALDPGGAGKAWQAMAARLPRPQAVLAISAHWEAATPRITSGARLETIHDFSGFPAPLYALRYDAPGSPPLAERISALLEADGLPSSLDPERGLDHGAWVPLRWMYPQVDVPVLQLSVQTQLGASHMLRLGRALAQLRGEGVLVLGTGHVTHNLRDWSGGRKDAAPLPYVAQFSAWLKEVLESRDESALLAWRQRAPAASRAHPTEEHFLPIFTAWGAAGGPPRATRFYSAIEDAALSMDAWRFD